MTPKKRPEKPRIPQQETYTLSSLDQIKVLADPLRIRILEAFCEERTTKQVATLLGEKPTKLYHHVDSLEKVGLIALSRTRPNRGTVEKYYLAVARTFRADSRAFEVDDKDGGKKSEVVRQMISTIFDTTAAEIGALVDQEEDATRLIEEEAIVSFLEIRASKAQLKEFREKLHALVQSLPAVVESDEDTALDRFRFTLAYFPLAGPKRGPRQKR